MGRARLSRSGGDRLTDLHRVLEAVVELHLNAPVFCQGIQDHPQEQLPHALENSGAQNMIMSSFDVFHIVLLVKCGSKKEEWFRPYVDDSPFYLSSILYIKRSSHISGEVPHTLNSYST